MEEMRNSAQRATWKVADSDTVVCVTCDTSKCLARMWVLPPLRVQLRSDQRRNARGSFDLTEVERFPNAFLLILHASFINVSSSECSQTESVSYGVVRYFDPWKTARINKNSDLRIRPQNFDKL
jgi:hypothetical protein